MSQTSLIWTILIIFQFLIQSWEEFVTRNGLLLLMKCRSLSKAIQICFEKRHWRTIRRGKRGKEEGNPMESLLAWDQFKTQLTYEWLNLHFSSTIGYAKSLRSCKIISLEILYHSSPRVSDHWKELRQEGGEKSIRHSFCYSEHVLNYSNLNKTELQQNILYLT